MINAAVKDFRADYDRIRKDESYLQSVLKEGAQSAFNISIPVLNRVRAAVGFGPFGYQKS